MSLETLEEKELLSVEDASRAFGVTKQTVTRLIRTNELMAEKVGNKWILRRDDLSQYMKSNNLVPEPQDHERRTSGLPDVVALSFFSGALGLDLGMEKAGIEAMLLCENDRKCRMTIESMRPNSALIGDISEYDASVVLRMAGVPEGRTVDVMFGGPPCQAFSTAGARKAFDDMRGNVFLRYIDLVLEIKPTYVVVENVRGLLSTPYPPNEGELPKKGGALSIVLQRLEAAGYAVGFNLYNAANFGAAQIRERVVLIGKLGKKKVPYLMPTNAADGVLGLPKWRTFRDAVEGLEEADMHYVDFPSKRLKYFKMLEEGQYWKHLPEDVQREAMGKSYALSGGKTGFYRRISFDRPCPTLVTIPTMPATDLCHPVKDRPLSIEEYKRVQGFPDEWRICGNLTDIYKQIGNAVPAALGEAIGRTILDDMKGITPNRSCSGF
ncbi:MAG: DNA cytosine methyltransferase, partial [Gordonibacter sp.]|uniref:DNA cytosine methyltransferase n=1 Tax=Gordonibacter sp. TaxID=1968902 RepID=UPI002FCB9EB9